MSVVSASVRATASSLDGFLRDRIRRPAKVTSGIVLKHYLGDIQKHEAIACGDGVRHMENSPGDDIKAMKKMLRDISSKFP